MTARQTPDQPLGVSDLIARCGRADEAAWAEFLSRYHRRISLYVLRAQTAGGDPARAAADTTSDLIQDVYLRLLANDRRILREFRGTTEPELLAYLARVASAVVIDDGRRRRSQKRFAHLVSIDQPDDELPSPAESLAAPQATSPDQVLASQVTPQRLAALIESVSRVGESNRDAVIFLLHAVEGLTAQEIASLPAFGLPLTTVKAVLLRTRERLRAALSKEAEL